MNRYEIHNNDGLITRRKTLSAARRVADSCQGSFVRDSKTDESIISINLTPDERKLIKQAADIEGISVNNYLCKVMKEFIEDKKENQA